MAKAQMGDIFLGITPTAVRQYMRSAFTDALRAGYKRIHIPCSGRFTIAEAALDAGWHPTLITCSDVSLFSSLLGLMCAGKPTTDLGVVFHNDLSSLNAYAGEKLAGAVMFGLKVSQLRGDRHHERVVLKELWRDPARYVGELHATAEKLVERIGGIQYAARDVREHVASVAGDDEAVVYVNPPGFARGYAKMFDTKGGITWKEPTFPEYEPTAGRAELYNVLMQAKALGFIFRSKAIEPGYQQHAVFTVERPQGRDYVLCNRPDEAPHMIKRAKPLRIETGPYAFMPDGYEIRPDAQITFAPVSKNVALYYRDLFAHKLGVVRAENYYVTLVDGYLMAVFGMFLSESRTHNGGPGCVYETFGFCAPNKRYPRINHLFMASLVSTDARRLFQYSSDSMSSVRVIDTFKTTCLSVTPEQKSHRSTGLKCVGKEMLPDGRYKLLYSGPFRNEDLPATIALWLKRMANVEKETGKPMGVNKIPAKLTLDEAA